MWYMCWILGVFFACACGIVNVIWYEMEQHQDNIAKDQQDQV
ncbi:cyd operon protein YbgT [Shewanella psychrophila]|uniref:Cyd operon protein YbgT n=1 Tax=Shewanella psychrophila TaxID=225848 RepID=A0A1S6HQU5_9GAMM|nr:cytochrome bd-I oxidase subunit CydX [Shewanella psychrophila]AQS37889.1 cyd operon protein YbgT [Shewanella psychrophila]